MNVRGVIRIYRRIEGVLTITHGSSGHLLDHKVSVVAA